MCSMYSDNLTLSSRIINNEGRARAPRAARRGPASAAWGRHAGRLKRINYRLNTKVKAVRDREERWQILFFCCCCFRSVLTSNRHQTTWFCPSAATQLRAGLRLPIGCTTIQQVPRNESCAVPKRSRGLLHPSQVRRTTNATKRHPGPRPSFVKLCRIFIWTTHLFSL